MCYRRLGALARARHANFECIDARVGAINRDWMRNDPDLDPLRAHPRFVAFAESDAEPRAER